MRSEEGTPFTPVDLCGLIAHETAAMLYGVGADSIPSAEAMCTGLDTPHLLDSDRRNAVPGVVMQMGAIREVFRTAVCLPDRRERIALQKLAVTLADLGGLSDVLMGCRCQRDRV